MFDVVRLPPPPSSSSSAKMNISEDKTNIGGKIYEGAARRGGRNEGRREGRPFAGGRGRAGKMNEGRVRAPGPSTFVPKLPF